MMNYDDMFNELDTIERVEIAYDCCNDTNNYKIVNTLYNEWKLKVSHSR